MRPKIYMRSKMESTQGAMVWFLILQRQTCTSLIADYTVFCTKGIESINLNAIIKLLQAIGTN